MNEKEAAVLGFVAGFSIVATVCLNRRLRKLEAWQTVLDGAIQEAYQKHVDAAFVEITDHLK